MSDEQCEDGTGIQHLGYKYNLRQVHSICQSLMTETVSEKLDTNFIFTWLFDRKDFIANVFNFVVNSSLDVSFIH
jgi:hypothetical protein